MIPRSIDHLSRLRSFGVKLVLLGGTMGALSIAGWAPETPRVAPDRPRPDRPRAPRVDMNHAPPETLRTLPGIGAVLAERIARYRREHGRFQWPAEIQNVKGIGPKRFEQLRPHIRVDRPQSAEASEG